jgi:Bardet-Biedl syndrome 7 protein
MNTLTFKGNFSIGEMHSWLRNCLPEVPDRVNSSNDNILMFKNVLVGSFLVCKYSRCDAEFKSDNISTIAILKDFITKGATTKHIKLELSTSKLMIFLQFPDVSDVLYLNFFQISTKRQLNIFMSC